MACIDTLTLMVTLLTHLLSLLTHLLKLLTHLMIYANTLDDTFMYLTLLTHLLTLLTHLLTLLTHLLTYAFIQWTQTVHVLVHAWRHTMLEIAFALLHLPMTKQMLIKLDIEVCWLNHFYLRMQSETSQTHVWYVWNVCVVCSTPEMFQNQQLI